MDATEIIEALGGASKIAQALGLGRSAVYNWNRAGIPPQHCHRLSEMARELGVSKAFRDARGKRQAGINLHTLVRSKPNPDRAKPRTPAKSDSRAAAANASGVSAPPSSARPPNG